MRQTRRVEGNARLFIFGSIAIVRVEGMARFGMDGQRQICVCSVRVEKDFDHALALSL